MRKRNGVQNGVEGGASQEDRVAALHAAARADYGTAEERADRECRVRSQSSLYVEYANEASALGGLF